MARLAHPRFLQPCKKKPAIIGELYLIIKESDCFKDSIRGLISPLQNQM